MTTKTGHTAGPWSYHKVDEDYIIETPDLKEYVGWAKNKENARLIATAPELLEALRVAIAELGRVNPDTEYYWLNEIYAKATGEK